MKLLTKGNFLVQKPSVGALFNTYLKPKRHTYNLHVHVGKYIKDDFQSALRSLSTLTFINIRSSHPMECESMLIGTNHIPYLRGLSNSFSISVIDFYNCIVVLSRDTRKNKA